MERKSSHAEEHRMERKSRPQRSYRAVDDYSYAFDRIEDLWNEQIDDDDDDDDNDDDNADSN
jgi:hypothetical protein